MRHLLFFLFLAACCHAEKLPVDIGFYVVDLKYNSEQGVKICEVQTIFDSTLHGYEKIYGRRCICTLFGSILKSYEVPVWLRRGFLFSNIREKNFHKVNSLENFTSSPLFIEKAGKELTNRHSIGDYQGIVCMGLKDEEFTAFHNLYPGMLVINAGGIPFHEGKDFMNSLFYGKKELVDLRPKWNVYKRRYSDLLADKILCDIPGQRLVIKPTVAARGMGVLIFPREKLKDVLKQLLVDKNSQKPEIREWREIQSRKFIVEEFVSSDPVELKGKWYDATMRAVCVLIYDQHEFHVEFLGAYWKLPLASLDQEGELEEMHKSKAEEFLPVDGEVLEKVEEQLKAGLPHLHQNMLTS